MLLEEEFWGIVRERWFTSQLQELLGKSHGLEVTNNAFSCRFLKANKPQTESCHVVTVRHGAGLHGEEGGGEADAAVTELMNNDNMKSILHGLDKGDR